MGSSQRAERLRNEDEGEKQFDVQLVVVVGTLP